MTQTLTATTVTPPAPARQGGAADSPEIVFILRHYRWMLVVGTLLGLIVSAALFVVLRRYRPEYLVEQDFQIMPAVVSDPLDAGKQQEALPSRDEIDLMIRRQIYRVGQDDVLSQAMKTDQFAGWVQRNGARRAELKKILDVSPIPNTGLFRIAMRGGNPAELKDLVSALSTTYYDALRQDEKGDVGRSLTALIDAQKTLEGEVRGLSSRVDDFRNTHDVSALNQAYQVKLSTLAALSGDLVRAETDTASAKQYKERITAQVKDGSLKLSAEQEQFVENDPSLRYLENNKLNLEADYKVNVLTRGEKDRSSEAIQTRINIMQQQINDMKDTLHREASLRMQEAADNGIGAAVAREDDLRKRHDELEKNLHDLDGAISEFASLKQTYENKQKLLDEYNNQLTREQLASRNDVSRVRQLGSVQVPEEPSWPQAKIFLPGGFVLGFLFSFGLAYLLEMTNTRVRTPRDITKTMQLPLLGFVPDQTDDSFVNGDLATSIRTSPASMTAESFRQIRGRLVAQANGRPLNTLLVASASPAGGATTVASNLANGIALNGLRVLLIDANFYRPGLRTAYPHIPAKGLSDVLAGQSRIDEVIVASNELPSLHLMSAGTIAATSASELVETRAFRDLLAQVRTRFDMVIFDGAPLNLVSDSLVLASKLEGVVAVVRAGAITRGTVARVRDQLKQVHANLLGIVLNAAQTRGSGYFKQNYRTFYEYAAPAIPAAALAPGKATEN